MQHMQGGNWKWSSGTGADGWWNDNGQGRVQRLDP